MEHEKLTLTLPWDEIEFEAQCQIIKILHKPELAHLAIMPDVHAGYELPIGGVALLNGYISPGYVGYDIGCGMCHSNFEYNNDLSEKDLEDILEELYKVIPVGFNKHTSPKPRFKFTDKHRFELECPVFTSADTSEEGDRLTKRVSDLQRYQLGTLGGGNHFIELGVNTNRDRLGITIHSGSRGCGYKIAEHYTHHGFLELDSYSGKCYIKDLEWATEFAYMNRLVMMETVKKVLRKYITLKEITPLVNEHHNYATVNSDGTVLHRKGATPALKDQLGLIPANMKDGVYLTKGLGNDKYLQSSSHGAGRVLSRKGAQIYHGNDSRSKLEVLMSGVKYRTEGFDEAPWAYKEIDQVLQYQVDLGMIEILDHFKPLLVVKG